MEAIVTIIMIGDPLEHTTVIGGLVVPAVTVDIMRNTLQRKKHLPYVFPMAEDRNTSRRVIVKSPRDRDPMTPGTEQIYGHLTHTDVLTDTWSPNRYQQEHEVLCEPSCNNS